jgi:hypothetical protein
MTTLISSCATTDGRVIAAAEAQGRVDAGVRMAALPADCRNLEAHAALKTGDELRATLVRERAALDRQNARTGRCADFYDDQRARLAQ